ncbi:hypothetical protein IJZ97_00040 [bacterium]|nr:hypothetical protein [bacterium]
MAIEFNGKGNVNNFKIGKNLEKAKDVVREENVTEEKPVVDNKFVKEVGEKLLTANFANTYGIKINKPAGEKIDKDFWGDALNDLNLKDTTIAQGTVKGIAELGTAFAIADMENKMAKSPFIQALNKEFGI